MKTPSSRPSMTSAREQAAFGITVPESEQREAQNDFPGDTTDHGWAIIPLITAPGKKNGE